MDEHTIPTGADKLLQRIDHNAYGIEASTLGLHPGEVPRAIRFPASDVHLFTRIFVFQHRKLDRKEVKGWQYRDFRLKEDLFVLNG